MNAKEIVSVVIPAYNAENFIKDAVKSCFSQTYRPIEVVVVNDGSTDSTVDVVDNLHNSIPDREIELRIVDIRKNQGIANALNAGFSDAKGNFICWLSADDMFIDARKIESQVVHMRKTEAFWSYFRDFFSGPTLTSANLVRSSYLPRLRMFDPLFIRCSDLRLMLLLFKNPINGSSIMLSRNCVDEYGQFDPVRNVDSDGDLWMRYSALRVKVSALVGATVFYRSHATQTSKRKLLRIHDGELVRMRILLALEKTGSLLRLIKKFTPCFPILLNAKKHFERPFVSEFLFSYILDHRKLFDRVFLKYIQRSLSSVRKHPNYRMLNRDKFMKDLDSLSKSPTFRKFEEFYRSSHLGTRRDSRA
jgi:glycosyltransferase involved in cell wall biosynthesis